MIPKIPILFRIQNFQKRSGRISLESSSADFINFVKKENGIFSICFSEGLDDGSWGRSDVCTTMTPDFGFVSDSAERDALEGPTESFGY
jgi:hypothetical protein